MVSSQLPTPAGKERRNALHSELLSPTLHINQLSCNPGEFTGAQLTTVQSERIHLQARAGTGCWRCAPLSPLPLVRRYWLCLVWCAMRWSLRLGLPRDLQRWRWRWRCWRMFGCICGWRRVGSSLRRAYVEVSSYMASSSRPATNVHFWGAELPEIRQEGVLCRGSECPRTPFVVALKTACRDPTRGHVGEYDQNPCEKSQSDLYVNCLLQI